MDVVTAYEQIGINEIRTIRTRADEEFDRIFSQSVKMAMLAGIGEIAIPKIARRQTLGTNVPREDRSAKLYWKRAIFVPYLHGLISELSDTFNDVSCQAVRVRGFCLIPNNVNTSCTDERIEDIESNFGADMPAPMSFKQDVRLWKRFCTGPSDQNALPTSLQATLENMNARQFPNICAVLRVLLLLPVTSAQVERAHSALKYIKTDLWNAMGEHRLNALVLL